MCNARPIIIAVLIMLAAFSAGCTDRGSTKEDLLAEGMRLMQEGNSGGAVVLFKNALEMDQNFFEARFQLAKAYYQSGNFDAAEKELQKVVRQNPSLKEAHIELARVYLQKSRPDDALSEVAALTGTPPCHLDALELSGWAHALKGNHDTAVSMLNQVIAADPRRVTAVITLARIYLRKGQKHEAKAYIDEVLKNDPSHMNALFLRAELQSKEHDIDGALKTYDQIIAKHPAAVEAHFKKGLLLIEKRRYDEALAIGTALLAQFPRSALGYELKGMALFYKKDFNESIIALQKSLAIMPSTGGYYFLGLSHYYKDEFEQATNQLQRALDLNPSFIQARILLSLIFLQQKRTDDAINEVKKVIEISRENAFAYNVLGSAYMAQGKYEEGMEAFDRAIAINPKLAEAHIKKGLYNFSKGRYGDAESELRAAVQVKPEVLNPRLVLASYYMKRKEHGRAIKTLKEGLNGGALDAVLYNYIAAAMLAEKKQTEALAYFRKSKETDPWYFAPYLNSAAVHLSRGDYEKAADEYKAVISRDPGNLKALTGLGALYEAQGNDQQALAYYKKAKETKAAAGFIALAQYYRKRNVERALATLDEALRAHPRCDEALVLKGKCYLDGRRYREAIETFERLEMLDPDRALPLLVDTFILTRDYEAALKRIESRRAAAPARIDLMAETARVYMLKGSTQKAVETAGMIIKERPRSAFGYLTLASIYEHQKAWERAIDEVRKGLAAEKNSLPALMKLADLYAKKGDYGRALDAYDTVIKAYPGNTAALFAQGTVFMLAGKKKEAVKRYRQVLDHAEDHVPALNNLACLYLEGYGSRDEALRLAERAYRLAPGNAEVMDTFGYLLLKKERTDEARRILERAAAARPDSPVIHYHLALACNLEGDRSKTVEHLQKAIGLGNFSEVQEARVLLASIKGASGIGIR